LNETANVLFSALRRKDFEPTLPKNDNRNAGEYLYRGFRGYLASMKAKKVEHELTFLDNLNYEPDKVFNALEENEKRNVISSIDIAKKKNAEVLIVVAPYFGALENDDYSLFHNYMKDLCAESGAGFLDFNLFWKDLKLNHLDFRDEGHLNLKGAKKVSIFLANYINTNYGIPSRESEPSWLEEQPQTLKAYIASDFEKDKIRVDHQFFDGFGLASIGFFKEGTSKQIILELNGAVTDSSINKYRLGFHTYVREDDEERLLIYSKEKNRTYDAWDFAPSLKRFNGKTYITKWITTPINDFPKVKLFLYDRSGYKGIIGNTLEVENVNVK